MSEQLPESDRKAPTHEWVSSIFGVIAITCLLASTYKTTQNVYGPALAWLWATIVSAALSYIAATVKFNVVFYVETKFREEKNGL